MKKLILTAAVCALLAGCKTNEANYRQAYEVAKQKYENTDTVSTGSHRLQQYSQPHAVAIGADTLMVLTERLNAVSGEGMTSSGIRHYNVVAGRFRQIFNARQMRQRLMGAGYGATSILASSMPLYYVVTLSTDTASQAAAELRKLEADSTLKFRDPLPFVISPR